MLPIATSVDGLAGQGSQGRGGLAPMIAKGPSRPALHAHNGASVVPRSKPLPVGRGPAGAGGAKSAMTALAEAPTAASSACHSEQVVEFGYDKNIEEKYELGRELGKGGNGVVRVARDRATGEEYACKALPKVLASEASDKKRAGHVDSIKREVEVMRRLAGSLAVVRLVDVYEDDDTVYLVMEWCKGGELAARIGERHYSERTAASYMRAVLRTLAQCHSHRILHRDVKPGNFMLLDNSDRSPLKAIDFGLAVPFDPESLPRTDLGFEGTPWYMAPEVLSSQVLPASDVWSAGVMAHQLLTGRLPFDDHRNPFAPSISAVWKSVLCDKVAYNMPWWQGISDDAKDFVASLLQRDPSKRPTAKEALKHPWLQGTSAERSAGRQIDITVVQRIQRFAASSLFKRSVFQLIAEELLARPGAAAALAASASQQDLARAGSGSGSFTGGSFMGGSLGSLDSSMHDADAAAAPPLARAGSGGALPGGALRELLRKLEFDTSASAVDRVQAAEALERMGFRLRPSEAAQLVDTMDTSGSGKVRRSAFAASQIDWAALQRSDVDAWIAIARRAFGRLDTDGDGVISADEIAASLRAKLPDDELRATLEQVMAEAGGFGGDGGFDGGLDFEGFLNMLRVGSIDSLDQYDARLDSFASPASVDRLQALLDASHHGSDGSSRRGALFRAADAGGAATPNGSATNGATAAGGAAVAKSAASGDYKQKAWNVPPPNFRFDFGGGFERAAAADKSGHEAKSGQADVAPAADNAPRPRDPWPGLPAVPGPRPPGAPMQLPGLGAGRGVGLGEVRAHGGSLYKNQAISGASQTHAHAHPWLETVKE